MIKLLAILVLSFITFSSSEKNNDSEFVVVKANYETHEIETILRDCETGGLPNACCSYWTVEQETTTFYWFDIVPIDYIDWSCTTGGQLKCIGCDSN